ncbi:hypothetical protein [Paenibacillus sp. FSL L8-0708]|uniref:hypothetical protein n=1 Tax=Paenibacillus sp. FSL L8-0708 TaxID=2975311 RepID=UPI0030F6AFEA
MNGINPVECGGSGGCGEMSGINPVESGGSSGSGEKRGINALECCGWSGCHQMGRIWRNEWDKDKSPECIGSSGAD